MSSRAFGKKMVWLRRAVQTAFLVLFLALLWYAGLRDAGQAPSEALKAFFYFDPLVMTVTWLAAHELPAAFLLALITIGLTIALGRVFCGWVCPLGTVHNMATWFRRYRGKARLRKDAYSGWQRAKYLLLAALVVMAVFGAHWIGVFDPLSLLYRSVTTTLYPGLQYAVEEGSNAVYQSDPHVGPLRATTVTEPAYRFMRDHVFVRGRQAFNGATLILLFFLAIVALNLYRPRFWCRYVCPLGALLGLCSKRPALRLETSEHCVECGRCAMACPAAASPEKPGHWRSTECFSCWTCVSVCHKDAISYRLRSPLPKPSQAKLDISKRAVLSAGVGGAGALVMMRLTPRAQAQYYNPELIRPPGAHEEAEFLKRCVKCGACMKVCPTNALHPTGLEAGLEGIWTPRLIPQSGYCEYNCNLCGQICPTEAIQPLPLEEKQKVKLGLATFDTSRCLPHAYGRTCLICEEHCPVSPKAIYFVEREVALQNGRTVKLKQPYVDPDRCIGCGICENVCVFRDRPAVRVTSANETRHSGNRPVLGGGSGSSGASWEDQTPPSAPSSDPYGQAESSSDPYGSS